MGFTCGSIYQTGQQFRPSLLRVLGAARASGSLPGKGSRRAHLYADAVLRRVFYDIIRSLAIIKDSGAVSPPFLQSFISLLQELVSR
jgi:hypothetical protein